MDVKNNEYQARDNHKKDALLEMSEIEFRSNEKNLDDGHKKNHTQPH